MNIKYLLMAVVAAMAIVTAIACGSDATPVDDSLQPSSASFVVGTPVPRSNVETTFGEPLSSGLSVADVVENALPSVVQIVASSGTGTGFIINESGLAVTNRHVVEGNSRIILRQVTGEEYEGDVTFQHPDLDLAYVQIDSTRSFTPIAIGDSDKIRVGEDVIAIGFPLGLSLGLEPTVSVGIVSARREDRLQTDASLNSGNSGGPLLDMFGSVVGVVVSRVETDDSGRFISGIGFAIPINAIKADLGGQVSPTGKVLPTPTPFPTIGPTPDLQATKVAIDAIDAHRREVELATRTAIEAQQESERYAASLEATRVAGLPTSTPEPTPTPLPPTPTPTPHPTTFCEEWEAMVLEWTKAGNSWYSNRDEAPDHPQLLAVLAVDHCITNFPSGILPSRTSREDGAIVGYGANQLLPGTYEYRYQNYQDDNRVKAYACGLVLNRGEDNEQSVEVSYGEPFTFRFFTYHGRVNLYSLRNDSDYNCWNSALYRIGD